jgi:hypothetical protein
MLILLFLIIYPRYTYLYSLFYNNYDYFRNDAYELLLSESTAADAVTKQPSCKLVEKTACSILKQPAQSLPTTFVENSLSPILTDLPASSSSNAPSALRRTSSDETQ